MNKPAGTSSCTLQLFTLLVFSVFAPAHSLGQDVAAGKILYETYCLTCHGPIGDGNGPASAEFVLKPRAFSLAAYKFDTDADWKRGTDADLADVIIKGPATYGGSSAMPGWNNFTQDEIKKLLSYIRSLET